MKPKTLESKIQDILFDARQPEFKDNQYAGMKMTLPKAKNLILALFEEETKLQQAEVKELKHDNYMFDIHLKNSLHREENLESKISKLRKALEPLVEVSKSYDEYQNYLTKFLRSEAKKVYEETA